ncbi:MAG: acetylxylan esterase [Saprospiraceae bacterium]|nr:acetylxylan esterase [Saprospiraceae bacterium]
MFPNLVFSQLFVSTDQPTGRYTVGDTIFFIVKSDIDTIATFSIKYGITSDLPSLSTGTCQVKNGYGFITYIPESVGFVQCVVTQNGQTNYGGAAIDPFLIQPTESEPADFDSFWAAQKTLLAAVPMNVNVQVRDSSATVIRYAIDMALSDGKRAYGYLNVPRGQGYYPALISLPAFGNIENMLDDHVQYSERGGVISVFLSIHANLPSQAGPHNYLMIGVDEPATYYYKHIMLAVIRTIDYLQTRTDFSGQVGIVGVSQGAGLAILAAGIEQRISLLVNAFPALCGHPNSKYNKPSGFPSYWNLARGLNLDQNRVLNTVKYYDAVTAAKRFRGVSWTMNAFRDETCNPATVYEAFNQLKGQKIISHCIPNSHTQTPDAFAKPNAPVGLYAFLRQHFPLTKKAPWQWTIPTVGHTIDVGKDIELTNTSSTTLRGVIELEYAAVNLPVRWEKVEGEGTVVFSNPESLTTTATFSKLGSYRLRLVAEDLSSLSTDGQYLTLADDLIVKVNTTIPVELVSFSGKTTEFGNQLTWVTASERAHKNFEIQRSEEGKLWKNLGERVGKGNAVALNTYEFTDSDPLSKAYYRLKQNDFNGDFQYSKTIFVERDKDDKIDVFPNPVFDKLTVDVKNLTQPFEVRIFDVLGRTNFVQAYDSQSISIDTKTWKKGQYMIEVSNKKQTFMKKIVKQ